MIVLNKIKKTFKENNVFENVNFEAKQGDLIAIKGKSGVGKSTLLNILAGLETPSHGEYYFNNIEMRKKNISDLSKIRAEYIGYISQFSPMIPKLTALENIYVPFWFRKNSSTDYTNESKIIDELSKKFEVNDILNKKIEKLSGGQIQRVGIIRALVKNPMIIIADEPTGSLDDNTTLSVINYFKELKNKGALIILATHNDSVANHCDKVLELTRDGLEKRIKY